MVDQYAYGYVDNPLNPTGTPDYFWELANPDDGLAALYLTPSTVPEDATVGVTVGAILGKTSGSTLSLTNNAGGRFAISGTNIVTAAALDYEAATSHVITLRETHAPATNSPRDTTLTITVTDIVETAPIGPFTLAWTSAASELTNLTFSLTPAPLVGDSVTLFLDNDAGVTSPFATSAANVIDAGEAAAGSLTFTGITTPLSPGLTYAKVNVVRGAQNVDSTIASKTLTGGAAYVGPGNIVSGANAWYGLRAYSAATAGTKAIRIRATGGAGTFETDINTLANGSLDVAAVSSFLTTHGGNAAITAWYDKSGNGRDLFQATPAAQPLLVLSGLGALPVVRYDGNDDLISTSFPSRPQPVSHSVVAKRTGGFGVYGGLLSDGSKGTGYPDFPGALLMYAGAIPTTPMTDNVWHTIQAAYDGATSKAYVDGAAGVDMAPGAGAFTPVYSVGGIGGSATTGDIAEAGEWPLKFTPTQATDLDANQSTYWGV